MGCWRVCFFFPFCCPNRKKQLSPEFEMFQRQAGERAAAAFERPFTAETKSGSRQTIQHVAVPTWMFTESARQLSAALSSSFTLRGATKCKCFGLSF